ncbi:MAG: hypothetical protein PHT69_00510 [Bacteroidales bacterium]|nr:hypothetical protein [Bacteroidales bacterium]
MLKILILSVLLVAFAVAALGVKMFFKKDGQFTKTCASMDSNGKKVPCSCKASGEDKCENYEAHHNDL